LIDPSAENTADALRRFFAEHLVPAAQSLRERHVTFFATGPDAAAESYFERHQTAASLFTAIEPEDCVRRLAEMWRAEGLDELADLAGPLADLVTRLAPEEEQSGELSPLIYVMF
jgi:hypothetical protein